MQFRGDNSLGTVFKNNQVIQTFNELALFTGIKNMQGIGDQGLFYSSTLRTLRLPSQLLQLGYRSLHGNTSFYIEELIIPTSVTYLSSLQASGYIGKIVIRSKLTTFIPHYFYGSSIHGNTHYTFVIDVDAVIPISGQNINMHYYYVRDDLVNAYKAASNWSTITSKIFPMSQLPS